jgi:hypothetical protein
MIAMPCLNLWSAAAVHQQPLPRTFGEVFELRNEILHTAFGMTRKCDEKGHYIAVCGHGACMIVTFVEKYLK